MQPFWSPSSLVKKGTSLGPSRLSATSSHMSWFVEAMNGAPHPVGERNDCGNPNSTFCAAPSSSSAGAVVHDGTALLPPQA